MRSKRGTRRIVHLSTHAEFKNGINDSYVYFRDDIKGKAIGRKVKLNQVTETQMEIPPEVELLFLAACQTAEDGDGSAELGFSGAFIQAKVKSVIASLWKVNYRETFVFSMEFYEQLRQGGGAGKNTKAAAIQRAQQALKNGHVYIKNKKLYLSSGRVIDLSSQFPADEGEYIRFTEPGDWTGLTIIGSPW